MENKKKIIIPIIIMFVIVFALIFIIIFKNNSKEIIDEHAIVGSISYTNQKEIDHTLKQDLETNKYTLDNAKVYLNPYNNSPLSALIIFQTEQKVSTTVTIKGKNDNDITYETEKNIMHYIPIYALYENYDNEVVIKLSNGKTQSFKIKTDDLGNYHVNSEINNAEQIDETDLYFISSPITMNSYIYDSYGELRYISFDNKFHDIHLLDNGHFLIGLEEMNDDYLSTKIIESDYLGRIYREYNIESGYLDSFYVKENGNILVASKKSDRKTKSDLIIEIDSKTGKVIKKVDVYNILSKVDEDYTSKLNEDYFYNSGIYLDEESNELVLSYWGGDFVINIDYETNEIKWLLSNPDNFTSNFEKYLLKTNGNTVYPKSVYKASIHEDKLSLFDTGYSVNQGITSIKQLQGSYSNGYFYKIEKNIITLIDETDSAHKYFSYALGDFEYLNDYDFIINFGRELKNNNFASDTNINNYSELESYIIRRKDNKNVLSITLPFASTYVKLIKNKNNNFNLEDTQIYTTLEETEKKQLTDDMKSKLDSAIISDFSIGYNNNIIDNNMVFFEKETAQLLLVDDKKEGFYLDLKEANKNATQKLYVTLDNKEYDVYLLINDTMYNTNKHIKKAD